MLHCGQGIAANDRWIFIERNVRGINKGWMRLTFDMINFFAFSNISLSGEQIFATGKAPFSRKHKLDVNYRLHISRHAIFTFQSLSIHVFNWLSHLLDKLLTRENKQGTGFDIITNALTHDGSFTVQTWTAIITTNRKGLQ